ncbi:type II toxin-antitoxin system VapC family toxin [Candidatus Tisiphia endosymbiont of Hybos culiciformis]|uniref:type II toxin-antitoxin system VapC family toxin n=1 Tax=Candidatus Tisiphia endosymbiont of Hybos culiciformis TaxID=3139331 RepID=UPI003CCAD986
MTKSFILDCSVAMSWCFEDEFDSYSEIVLNSLAQSKALVPPLWILEVINVLLMAEKRGRLKTADSTRFIDLLGSLAIYTSDLSFSMSEIINTARSHKLTSYDANYLLLAMHEGLSIATKDNDLINACRINGVEIFLDTSE